MSRDPESELKTLRGMLGLPEPEPEAAPTAFAQDLAQAMGEAVVALRAAGIIEVEDENVEALTQQVAQVALEATSLKRLPVRITKTLINSDLVEEVFGTDAEISTALRPFLEAI
jgi:hypothetical protein